MQLTRVLGLTIVILVVAGLAVGCGASDGSSSKSDDTKASSTAATEASDSTAQRSIDLSKQTRASIKDVINVIESCAASNVNGTYSKDIDCLDPKVLIGQEPGAKDLLSHADISGVGTEGSGYMGYQVTLVVDDGGSPLSFTETHEVDGTIDRTCAPKDAPGCNDGTW